MAARPVVDGIERRFSDRLTVLRLDMQSPAGATLSREMGALYTPTFLLFDPRGVVVLRRVGQISSDDVARLLGS
jgi:hypothetical protein